MGKKTQGGTNLYESTANAVMAAGKAKTREERNRLNNRAADLNDELLNQEGEEGGDIMVETLRSKIDKEYPTPDQSSVLKRMNRGRELASEQSDKDYLDSIRKRGSVEDPKAAEAQTKEERSTMVNDFVAGLEVIPAVGSGLLKAAQNTGNMVLDAGNAVEEFISNKSGFDIDLITNEKITSADDPSFTYQPTTTVGKLVEGFAQFAIPYAGLSKLTKASQAKGFLGQLAHNTGIGAMVDMSVIDPKGDNLSAYLRKFPVMRNIVPEFLATNPKDEDSVNRLRNVLEGAGLGVAVDSAVKLFSAIRGTRYIENGIKDADSFAKKADELGVDLTDQVDEAGNKIVPPEIEQIKSQVKEERRNKLPPLNFNDTLPPPIPTGGAKSSLPEVPKEFVKEFNKLRKSQPDNFFEAKRKILNHAELKKMADNIGVEPEDILGRELGETTSAENIIARYQTIDTTGKEVKHFVDGLDLDNLRDEDVVKFINMMDRQYSLIAQTEGGVSEVGRSLGAAKFARESVSAQARYVNETIKANGGRGSVAKVIRSIKNMDDPTIINKIASRSRGRAMSDVATELMINSFLSGPMTHVRNFVGNTMTGTLSVAERKTAELFSKGSPSSVQKGEASAMIDGLMNGIMDSIRISRQAISDDKSVKQALLEGKDFFLKGDKQVPIPKLNSQKYDYGKALNSRTFNKAPDSVIGKFLDVAGEVVNIPVSMLSHSDDIFKAANYRMELHAQAHRKAILNRSTGMAEDMVIEEYKKFLSNPSTKEIMLESVQENTFTKAIDQLDIPFNDKGQYSKVAGVIADTPIARTVVPFIKTPLNIFEYGLKRTPFATGLRQEIAKGGVARDMALARVSLGSTVMAVGAYMTTKGTITGKGPADFKARKALQESGVEPYTIELGGKRYKYDNIEPFGSLLKMSADLTELMGYAQSDNAQVNDVMMQSVMAVAEIYSPEFLMDGIGTLVEAIQGDERAIEKMIRPVSSIATPLSGVAKMIDPVKRETRVTDENSPIPIVSKLIDQIRAGTPFLSEDLPPRRNIWGEVKTHKSFLAINPDEDLPLEGESADEPIFKEIQRLNMLGTQAVGESPSTEKFLQMDMPPKYIQIRRGGVSMTSKLSPEQYDRFVQLSAGIGLQGVDQPLKEYLSEQISNGYPDLPYDTDEMKRRYIQKTISEYRKAAKEQLLTEFDDIEQELMGDAEEKINRITGGETDFNL